MFVNEVRQSLHPRGMTTGAPPHNNLIAMPATGYTATSSHAHAKPSSFLLVVLLVTTVVPTYL